MSSPPFIGTMEKRRAEAAELRALVDKKQRPARVSLVVRFTNLIVAAALILGAGFSYVGGLPLTRDLFALDRPFPPWLRKVALTQYEEVAWAYERELRHRPNLLAEEWLLELYRARYNPFSRFRHGTHWRSAMRFALARLVDDVPDGWGTSAYYHGIGTYRCHPVHRRFWEKIENELRIKNILTFNYDILVEQALHSSQSSHRTTPRCRYGGFPFIQSVKRLNNVITRKPDLIREYELVSLGNDFVLYKLHGSINWAFEPHSESIKIHEDVRAVFRVKDRFGEPAVIPPIPEKEIPEELANVWIEARKVLLKADCWIVCGYSLPPYDHAVRAFFREIAARRSNLGIVIIDPDSEKIAERWREFTPTVRTLPGLPEALEERWA